MLDAEVKTKIMNEVDRQFDDQTKVLADLVKIPSTRFREAPAQDMMARLFKEDRLSVDRWQIKIDDLKHLPGYSPHSQDYDDAWNVVGAWRPGSPKGRPSWNGVHSPRGGRVRSICGRTKPIATVGVPRVSSMCASALTARVQTGQTGVNSTASTRSCCNWPLI